MDCTDAEKRLFWGCIQMETRYGQDLRLPASGLSGLELVTEMYNPNYSALTIVYLKWMGLIVPPTCIHRLIYFIAFLYGQ